MSVLARETGLRAHIRWLIARDMPEILEIEQTSYDNPWTEADFLACLRLRNCIGMVAELGERVVGYMMYELHKTRIDVLNFAVHHAYRRKSIGTQMVNKLVSKLSGHRRTSITVTVRETNLPMQLFLKANRLEAFRVDREHFDDTNEDAIVFRLRYHGGFQ